MQTSEVAFKVPGTMGSRTGRKGETALSGSTAETPQARRFPYRKFDDQRNRWFFEGESLKYQRPFQPARTWRFFLENTATVEGGEALRRKLLLRLNGQNRQTNYSPLSYFNVVTYSFSQVDTKATLREKNESIL
jgi:hypothetical protein